ncbi:MAG: helix-turn-helix transcriptional regulator [Clostridia bacterium]|nr:helix-turn-helix transcriptional regulator [Clostridia bacterium]
MNAKEIIGALETERTRQRISRDKLEKRTGVSKASYAQWHKRKTGPYLGHVTAVADALGFDLQLTRKGAKQPPRLLDYEELRRPVGFGFLEEHLTDDEGQTVYTLAPCCWTHEADRVPYGVRLVTPEEGEYLTPVEETYNVPGGWRVWTLPARKAQRLETPWTGRGGT